MSDKPWANAPMRAAKFLKQDPEISVGADGTIYVAERHPLPPYPVRITDPLAAFAKSDPDRVFLADRKTGGEWRKITYGEMFERARRIGQYLLDAGLSVDRPIAILSGNDIEHASIELGAMYAGVACAVISPTYSLAGGDYARFRDTIEAVTPGMIYAADASAFAPAINAVAPGIPFIADTADHGATPYARLLETEPTAAVDEANARITGDTVAKFLFTSGSTGSPKAVPNTHRMICVNQVQTRESFAFLKDEPPVILDWAPWNHTAGGNKVFFMTMFSGGTFHIDDGRPTKADTWKTVRNLKEVSPTWYFNVPTGFDALIPYLEEDKDLRENFFRDLKMLWYAGASLSQHLWDALERLAVETTGTRIVIGTGLGATETAPGAIYCITPQESAGNVGLPVPGVTLKLVPMDGKLDARVKGPNIMTGYWRQPELSAKVFDEEGFYCFGDALLPVDPDDLTKGFRFDGRTAENFKLDTGTWVNTGALRMTLIEHFGDLVREVAITGADKPYLGALFFPKDPSKVGDPAFNAALKEKLTALAAKSTGSSNRVRRLLIVAEPPSMDAGELTDKGSLNQRAVLRNRAELVDELYAGSDRVVEAARG